MGARWQINRKKEKRKRSQPALPGFAKSTEREEEAAGSKFELQPPLLDSEGSRQRHSFSRTAPWLKSETPGNSRDASLLFYRFVRHSPMVNYFRCSWTLGASSKCENRGYGQWPASKDFFPPSPQQLFSFLASLSSSLPVTLTPTCRRTSSPSPSFSVPVRHPSLSLCVSLSNSPSLGHQNPGWDSAGPVALWDIMKS
ncbi:hypothetical protein SODALDRAFT_82063 [Sodiomyces alkalinus F11]|uniref:Uncharacterized protein n=1 Tax=Sodiomyces alkalinus (strain CBS 110278 / VKM F-3762 / F11) TaxID=1314773 RepID=A0A3N2PJG0_SODAK|nr:hypothetical protein SODALDRAFT_82063 [Sodiomyces alkalinus F11]ROT34649.1 hypothetical protein SODALDRAFT_82063 [Sodiomyces alkalinus F11]